MARFEITTPDGKRWEVESDSPENAHRTLQEMQRSRGGTAPSADSGPLPFEDDSREYELEAAMASPLNRGVRRFARQFADTATLGYLPRFSDKISASGESRTLSGTPEYERAERRQNFLTEASRHSVPGSGAAQWTADVAARTAGGTIGALISLPAGVARNVAPAWQQAQGFAGGALQQLRNFMMPPNVGRQALQPTTTMGQNVREGARIGTTFGVAGGQGTAPPDASLGEVLTNQAVHGAGGAVVGAGLPLAMEGIGRTGRAARDLGETLLGRGPEARARAEEFAELGLEPSAVALSSPGRQTAAGRLADIPIVGNRTREAIGSDVEQIEAATREALLGSRVNRGVNEAGAEAQEMARRGLYGQRSEEELAALGEAELQSMSGTGPTRAAPVTPTTVQEVVERRARQGLGERLAGAQAASRPPRRSLSQRLTAAGDEPEPLMDAPEPEPVAAPAPVRHPPHTLEGMMQEELESLPPLPTRNPDVPSQTAVGARAAQLGPRRAALPERPELMADTPEEAAALFEARQRVQATPESSEYSRDLDVQVAQATRALELAEERLDRLARLYGPWPEPETPEDAGIGERITTSIERGQRRIGNTLSHVFNNKYVQQEVERRTHIRDAARETLERLQRAQANTGRRQAEHHLRLVEEAIQRDKIERWRAAWEAENAHRASGIPLGQRAGLHETTREAAVSAEEYNARRVYEREQLARERAIRRYQAANMDAEADTLRRQDAADAAHRAAIAAQPEQMQPEGLPRRPESFREQLAAGEEALRRNAPPPPRPLLHQPNSAIRTAMEDIGDAARGMGLLPGFNRSNVFNPETGQWNDDLQAFLEPIIGPRLMRIMNVFSMQFQRGHTPQGVEGISNVRRALIEAQAATKNPEKLRVLRQLEEAVNTDFHTILRETSGGSAWIAQSQRLDAVRRRIATELEEPLRAVLGPDTSPADALRMLQRSAQTGGDIRTLQAFLRVAAAKGDKTAAQAMVLQGLNDGGMREFLGRWRGLSLEGKKLLFDGNLAPLGQKLDQLAALASKLEQIAQRTGRQGAVRRLSSVVAMATGVAVMPATAAALVGAKGVDILLGSRGFARWLARMPVGRGEGAWRPWLAQMRGARAEQFGLNERVGEALTSAFGVGSASAAPGRTNRPGGLMEPIGENHYSQDDNIYLPREQGHGTIYDTHPSEVEGEETGGRFNQPRSRFFRPPFDPDEESAPIDWEQRDRSAGPHRVLFGGRRAAAPPPGDSSQPWGRSGWLRGEDRLERFEIDDSQADITDAGIEWLNQGGSRTLGEVLNHEELFRQYPQLRTMKITLGRSPQGQSGGFFPSRNEIVIDPERLSDLEDAIGTILHEVQHRLQKEEGFSYGHPRREYALRPGEVEARTVEERLRYTPEERARERPLVGEERGPSIDESARIATTPTGPAAPRLGNGIVERPRPLTHGKGSVQQFEVDPPLGAGNALSRVLEFIGGGRASYERHREARVAGQLPEMGWEDAIEMLPMRGGARGPRRAGMLNRKLTDDEIEQIVQAHVGGSSLRNIADDFSVSHTQIGSVLRAHGRDTSQPGAFAQQNMAEGARRGRERGRRYVDVSLEHIARLRDERGLNGAEIAREVGAEPMAITRALRRHEMGHTGTLRVEREMAEGAPYKPQNREGTSRVSDWRRRRRALLAQGEEMRRQGASEEEVARWIREETERKRLELRERSGS